MRGECSENDISSFRSSNFQPSGPNLSLIYERGARHSAIAGSHNEQLDRRGSRQEGY